MAASKEVEIKKYLESHKYIHVPIDEKSIDGVYKILIENDTNIDEDNDIMCQYLGLYYNANNKPEDAKKYYLLAIKKGNLHSINNYATLCRWSKEYDEAKKYYLMAIHKGHVYAMNNYSFMCLELKKYDDAKKYAWMAIENGFDEAINNYAYVCEILKEYEEAKKYYLIAIENGSIFALNNYAHMCETLNMPDDAKKYYSIAIKKDYKYAACNYAALCANLEEYEESKKYYLMAIEKGCDKHLCDYADVCIELKEYKEAAKFYLAAIEKDKDNIEAMNGYALACSKLEKYDEAKKYYMMGIERGANSSMNDYAFMCQELKMYHDAKKYYMMAIEKGNTIATYNYNVCLLEMVNYNLDKCDVDPARGQYFIQGFSESAGYDESSARGRVSCGKQVSLDRVDAKKLIKYFSDELIKTGDKDYTWPLNEILRKTENKDKYFSKVECNTCHEDNYRAYYKCLCEYTFMCIKCYDKLDESLLEERDASNGVHSECDDESTKNLCKVCNQEI